MAIAFRAVGNSGVVNVGAGAITVALPPGLVADDIILLLLETANQAITVADAAGGTWTEVTNSPQGQGTGGAAGGVRLTVFWSRYNGVQTAPITSDSGEHNSGVTIAYSGVITSGLPYDVTAGDTQAATTAGSIPGVTTTVDGCLLLAIAASDADVGTQQATGWTNASLVSVTERIDSYSATGTGGGIVAAGGIKTTAGVVSPTTWTQGTSAALCNLMIALRPPAVDQTLTGTLFSSTATFFAGTLIQGAAPPSPTPSTGGNRMGGSGAIRKPPRHVGR